MYNVASTLEDRLVRCSIVFVRCEWQVEINKVVPAFRCEVKEEANVDKVIPNFWCEVKGQAAL